MVRKYRDLTEKYRSFRLRPDALYHSRTLQTLFNKFTKSGKKATARKHIIQALFSFRFSLKRPRTYNTLTRILRSLRLQLMLVSKRQSSQMLEVPVPVRRNKRDIMSLQTLYSAVRKRNERLLSERIEQELISLTVHQAQSPTLRQHNAYLRRVFDERANMEKR